MRYACAKNARCVMRAQGRRSVQQRSALTENGKEINRIYLTPFRSTMCTMWTRRQKKQCRSARLTMASWNGRKTTRRV